MRAYRKSSGQIRRGKIIVGRGTAEQIEHAVPTGPRPKQIGVGGKIGGVEIKIFEPRPAGDCTGGEFESGKVEMHTRNIGANWLRDFGGH